MFKKGFPPHSRELPGLRLQPRAGPAPYRGSMHTHPPFPPCIGNFGAYLSAREIVLPRQDLGPPVERASGWQRVKLQIIARLGHISVAMAVLLTILAAILASLSFVCVRRHVGCLAKGKMWMTISRGAGVWMEERCGCSGKERQSPRSKYTTTVPRDQRGGGCFRNSGPRLCLSFGLASFHMRGG